MLRTPAASNGAIWPAVIEDASPTAICVGPSAATATAEPPRAARQPMVATRRVRLNMGSVLLEVVCCAGAHSAPGPGRRGAHLGGGVPHPGRLASAALTFVRSITLLADRVPDPAAYPW